MNDLFLIVGVVVLGLCLLVFGLGALLVLLTDAKGAAYSLGRRAGYVIKGVLSLVVLGCLFTVNTVIVMAMGLDPYAGAIKNPQSGADVSPLLLLIGLASFVEFAILNLLRVWVFGKGRRQGRNE